MVLWKMFLHMQNTWPINFSVICFSVCASGWILLAFISSMGKSVCIDKIFIPFTLTDYWKEYSLLCRVLQTENRKHSLWNHMVNSSLACAAGLYELGLDSHILHKDANVYLSLYILWKVKFNIMLLGLMLILACLVKMGSVRPAWLGLPEPTLIMQ